MEQNSLRDKMQKYQAATEKRKKIRDWKVQVSAILVFLGLIVFLAVHYDVFKGASGTWADIVYIVTGPLLFYVGTAYAPVWITCLIYLVYSIIYFIIAVIAANISKPTGAEIKAMTPTMKELMGILSDYKEDSK